MTATLIGKALTAKRETKAIEFKQGFDCDSKGEWCEVIKDLVAMANSGGGIVVFGLGNTGELVETDVSRIAALDPADIANKVGAYIGSRELDIEIHNLEKNDHPLVAFVIGASSTPFVFEKHGAYQDSLGKQKSAFALGTAYFRHGAKSEPGTNEDLRRSISRQIDVMRKQWLSGVRKVVEAPQGSQIIVSAFDNENGDSLRNVRVSDDLNATAIRLTRDSEGTVGTLMHEEISDALLSEINNVIEMNSKLFPGQDRFLLSPQVYFRIYAERRHVDQPTQEITRLLDYGISEYKPFLYWCSLLNSSDVARRISVMVLKPKGVEVNSLLRLTKLLGQDFYKWLELKFTLKWGTYSQPPSFYWRLKNIGSDFWSGDLRLQASGLSPQSQVGFGGSNSRPVSEILNDQAALESTVTNACLDVFKGSAERRAMARDFDYLAHGGDLIRRGAEIGSLIKTFVGSGLPADTEVPESPNSSS